MYQNMTIRGVSFVHPVEISLSSVRCFTWGELVPFKTSLAIWLNFFFGYVCLIIRIWLRSLFNSSPHIALILSSFVHYPRVQQHACCTKRNIHINHSDGVSKPQQETPVSMVHSTSPDVMSFQKMLTTVECFLYVAGKSVTFVMFVNDALFYIAWNGPFMSHGFRFKVCG